MFASALYLLALKAFILVSDLEQLHHHNTSWCFCSSVFSSLPLSVLWFATVATKTERIMLNLKLIDVEQQLRLLKLLSCGKLRRCRLNDKISFEGVSIFQAFRWENKLPAGICLYLFFPPTFL